MVEQFARKITLMRLPNVEFSSLRSRIGAWGVAMALWVLATEPAAAAPSFQTSLDRNNIGMGETVNLTLRFNDCSPNQPELPPIDGLQPAGPTSRTDETQFINGQVNSSVVYTVPLRPTHTGTFNIPSLQANINGMRLSSQPLTLTVGKSTAAQGAFVKLVVPDKPAYVGQIFPAQIQAYCQYAQNIQLPQLSGDGFNVGAVPSYNRQPPQVNINGTAYNYFDFRAPVTAVKTGKLTLGPASWSLVLVTQRRDPLWPFGGGFGETHPLTVSSDPASVEVLPIPTNAPLGFGGAIGTFSLVQYEVGPTNVAVGDPITLKIRIAGKGAFDGVTLASDPVGWREFKTYPPTSKIESSDPIQIEGSKYFEQVITPLNAEIKELPSFNFAYFDPDAGAFRTLTHPPVPLAIHPASGVAQPTVVSLAPTAETQPPAQEIVHIKEHLGLLE